MLSEAATTLKESEDRLQLIHKQIKSYKTTLWAIAGIALFVVLQNTLD